MSTVTEYFLKIKTLADQGVGEWGLFALMVLIGIGSFGLGRLSVLEDVRPPVALVQAPQLPEPRAMYIGGLIVASRTGSVYYVPWCAAALKIDRQNQLWFASEEAAQQAGYTSAKSCKEFQ